MNKQEDFQNRALALLLSERGVVADYEQRAGRRRIDIVAEVEGLRVVLEAETGFHRKAQAIKDADARLRQRLATVVFAVCYPDGVTEDDLTEATLTWTVRMKAGEPSGEWSTGDVSQLAQAVLAIVLVFVLVQQITSNQEEKYTAREAEEESKTGPAGILARLIIGGT